MLFTWKDATPAVAINTKMGHVFVLNRLTGAPLLPVEERPVPQTDIAGEKTWPTQPFSTIALAPEKIPPEDMWGKSPEDLKWCQEKLKASRWDGMFTPPSLKGTAAFPGNVGGVNWGSSAYDPLRHLMFANTNRLIAWVKLIPRANYSSETSAAQDNRIYGEFGEQEGAAFGLYRTFLFSPGGTPCNTPPWGTTAAVDLFTGKILWNVPLGSFVPGQHTGTINLGGPIAPPLDWSSPAPPWTISFALSIHNPAKNYGPSNPAGGKPLNDLHLQRQTIYSYCRRWPRQARHQTGRLRSGLLPPVASTFRNFI
jgi:quinoprotein glucose dehydrogenase